MLDPDDEQVIKDCKAGGGVLVTWDRVLREAAGGLTPIEVMQQVMQQAREETPEAPPEAKAELDRLLRLSPEQLTVMADGANETWERFNQHIRLDKPRAKVVRHLRVMQGFSWRAVARRCALLWKAPWGGNQIAGMVICEQAAKMLGEDFMKEPWNTEGGRGKADGGREGS